MSEFKEYRNIQTKEIRPYVKGEDLSGISVSEGIDPEKDKGYIARDPNNHEDQWYIPKKFYKDNFVEVVEGEEQFVVTDNADVPPFEFISSGISNGQLLSSYGIQTGRGVALMTVVEAVGFISNDIEFLPEARIVVNEDGTKIIK